MEVEPETKIIENFWGSVSHLIFRVLENDTNLMDSFLIMHLICIAQDIF